LHGRARALDILGERRDGVAQRLRGQLLLGGLLLGRDGGRGGAGAQPHQHGGDSCGDGGEEQ
ncbi:MAG: hypothetical protein ACK55I_36415, partial [bacterium]